MPNILAALAKLAAERERLRQEKAHLDPQIKDAQRFHESVTTNTLAGHKGDYPGYLTLALLIPIFRNLLYRDLVASNGLSSGARP